MGQYHHPYHLQSNSNKYRYMSPPPPPSTTTATDTDTNTNTYSKKKKKDKNDYFNFSEWWLCTSTFLIPYYNFLDDNDMNVTGSSTHRRRRFREETENSYINLQCNNDD